MYLYICGTILYGNHMRKSSIEVGLPLPIFLSLDFLKSFLTITFFAATVLFNLDMVVLWLDNSVSWVCGFWNRVWEYDPLLWLLGENPPYVVLGKLHSRRVSPVEGIGKQPSTEKTLERITVSQNWPTSIWLWLLWRNALLKTLVVIIICRFDSP